MNLRLKHLCWKRITVLIALAFLTYVLAKLSEGEKEKYVQNIDVCIRHKRIHTHTEAAETAICEIQDYPPTIKMKSRIPNLRWGIRVIQENEFWKVSLVRRSMIPMYQCSITLSQFGTPIEQLTCEYIPK